MNPDLIGWLASAILMATLLRQIWKQWQDDDASGVSHLLFIGQMLSSAGFVAYSWMLQNWVFIITNSLLLLTAAAGQLISMRKRRSGRAGRDVDDRPGP
ncbi:MAG: hypothetical protein EOP92_16970 [Lysobacteraceae bacterium]|nr:MAG: hypothetical protein EOP92_16970 [Xanthomonadaceae bacterium]